MEITKEQVLEMYEWGNSTDKLKMKKWFPEAFGLEVGKWYIHTLRGHNDMLFNFQGKYSMASDSGAYGFTRLGVWHNNLGVGLDDPLREATHDEVSNALIREAKKRGYKYGNYYCLSNSKTYYNISDKFTFEDDKLFHGTVLRNVVFADGEWAEIIETITKEEAEKLLNKKII